MNGTGGGNTRPKAESHSGYLWSSSYRRPGHAMMSLPPMPSSRFVSRRPAADEGGSIDDMAELEEFLPADAAAWLKRQLLGPRQPRVNIRIDGPPASGKTQLLTAFADTVRDKQSLGGLSETREGLECLRGHPGSLMLVMPALLVRGLLDRVPNMVADHGVDVVFVDDPSDETWAMLGDIDLAGPRIWAATSTTNRPPSAGVFMFKADIFIRLGLDPHRRVELITYRRERLYWIDSGEAIFRPETAG